MNKNRILSFTLLIFALSGILLVGGCKKYKLKKAKKRQEAAASPIQGSWQMLGYINPNSHDLKPLPDDQGRGIVLHCKDDGTNGKYMGHTKMNEIIGHYTVSDHHQIIMSEPGGTKVGEPKWGNRFWKSMKSVHSYKIHQKQHHRELHLIYDEANARMVFKEIVPEKE